MVRDHIRSVAALMRWRLAFAFALMASSIAAEGLGVIALLPVMRALGLDVGDGAIGRVEQAFTDILGVAGLQQSLGAAIAVYIVTASLHVVVSRYQTLFNIRLEQDLVRRLRHRLYRGIVKANWAFLARQRGTDFTHALTRELDRVGAATAQLTATAATALAGLVYFILAVAVSPALTAVVTGSGVLLLFVLRSGAGRARQAGEAFSRASSRVHATAIEHLAGIKTIKSHVREEQTCTMFDALADDLARAHVRAAEANSGSKAYFDLGAVWILGVALFTAAVVLQLPAGSLLLLLFLFARIMPRVSSLQQNVHHYLTFVPSVLVTTKLQAQVDAALECDVPDDPRMLTFRREIRFDNVGFRYAEHDAWTLRNITLTLEAGATTALVGSSGAGKSTLADLVMGLLVPDEGIITVDDEPLDERRFRAWRNRIGFVAQDPFLLHDTVRANLLWADPAATDDDIERALQLAAADQFVAALPDGLSTLVGDRGVKLSGGERQRLALARALLRKPTLLILDEATASLDSENEQRIQQAIDALHGSVTMLVIAHRLSTIRSADVIHVLEHGQVVESGDWDTLLARPGSRFRQLHTAQHAPSRVRVPSGLLRV